MIFDMGKNLKFGLEERIPPSGGSGVTIGQRPVAPCQHDFTFLRTEPMRRAGENDIDVFYCRRCLEYRKVIHEVA